MSPRKNAISRNRATHYPRSVVAEALEYGKPVITTDGAPAWEPEAGDRLVYLRGYREGTDEERVKLLKDALNRWRK